MTFVWLGAMILFLVVEAATVGLASIWFALGSLAAMLLSAFKLPIWLQIVAFLAVSAATMVFTRPIAKKYFNPIRRPTNADRVLLMQGVVIEEIDNLGGTGAVSVGGKIWTARSANGTIIPKDTVVKASAIEGVKLIVSPVPAEIVEKTEV